VRKLTDIEAARLRGWLAEIEKEADHWADKLDPQRTFKGELARKLDVVGRYARDARFYLNEDVRS
jgi:hypothetical protein